MDASARKAKTDHEARAWLAWHTAVLGRVEKMPPLSDLTGVKPELKKMTPAEMRGVFAAMRGEA